MIDTNVLVHANNPEEMRQEQCQSLLGLLLDCETMLAVDEGFNQDPSKNRSHIGQEYIENLRAGMLGYTVVSKLASSKRIRVFPKRAAIREQKIIIQLLRKPVDRVFLGVACNSSERTLVSHDYEDFQEPKRDTIHKELGVLVIEANQVLSMLE